MNKTIRRELPFLYAFLNLLIQFFTGWHLTAYFLTSQSEAGNSNFWKNLPWVLILSFLAGLVLSWLSLFSGFRRLGVLPTIFLSLFLVFPAVILSSFYLYCYLFIFAFI